MLKKYAILFLLSLILYALPETAQAQKSPAGYKNKEFLYRKTPAPLPNYYFFDATGRKIQIGEFEGKVIILNLWGTGCPTCVVEMPMFSRLQNDLKGQIKVIPLSVGTESVTDVMKMYQKMGTYNLDVYKDWNGELADRLNIKTIPTTLLIDPEGREIGRLTGMAEWDGPLIKSQIMQILSEYNKGKK